MLGKRANNSEAVKKSDFGGGPVPGYGWHRPRFKLGARGMHGDVAGCDFVGCEGRTFSDVLVPYAGGASRSADGLPTAIRRGDFISVDDTIEGCDVLRLPVVNGISNFDPGLAWSSKEMITALFAALGQRKIEHIDTPPAIGNPPANPGEWPG